MVNLTETRPGLKRSIYRTGLRIAFLLAIAYGVHLLMNWVIEKSEALSPQSQTFMLTSLLVVMLLAYALLISIPFVPGIEIGVSLILFRGAAIVPYIFLATLSGLALAYLAGRYIKYMWLRKMLLDLGLSRPADFLERMQAIPQEKRIDLLSKNMPKWLGKYVVRWRYILLATLINIPGNALIGGGGGICLVAGLSRVFSPLATMITIALAVAPVPLLVWFFDFDLSAR